MRKQHLGHQRTYDVGYTKVAELYTEHYACICTRYHEEQENLQELLNTKTPGSKTIIPGARKEFAYRRAYRLMTTILIKPYDTKSLGHEGT